ncbi:MAG: ROK family protein [Acidobacteria bacterium]|nr:ROK family protein [Acidobacteriota bacterium]
MNRSNSRISSQPIKRLVIGIEIDRQEIAAGLVDERARVVAERKIEMPQRTTRSAAAAIAGLVLGLASAEERNNCLIGAVGVSVPGSVDPQTERVSIEGWKGWKRLAIKQMIEEQLSDSGYDIRSPVDRRNARSELSDSPHPHMAIHSRAVCVAAAESWNGAARGSGNVVYLSLGEVIDVGIISSGQAIRGAGGHAGAVSWLGLSENYKQDYQSRGCLATEATAASFTRRAIEEWSDNSRSILGKLIRANAPITDAEMIIRAARGGDALALKVVVENCRWIGRGVSNLISILNPDTVIVGGGLGKRLKPFLDVIREEAHQWASPQAVRECRIVGATLGAEAALVGAARLAGKF